MLGASPREIAAAQHSVSASAVKLTRLADAIKLYQERKVTVRYFGRA